MKKICYIIFVLIALFGCAKENELTPTDYVRDWMVIEEPTTDDPVDQLRYEIYNEYGVSTYYNDTLGSETRVDGLGTVYTHNEVLKVFYNPGSSKFSGAYSIMKDHSCLEVILRDLKDHILPNFDENVRFKAFLFVDSLWKVSYSSRTRLDSYYGYNTMVMNVDSLKEWGVEKLNRKFLKDLFVGMLSASEYSSWKNDFLNVSKKMNPLCDPLYSKNGYNVAMEEAMHQTSFTKKEELGFITSTYKRMYMGPGKYETKECTPEENEDLLSYLEAVLTCSAAEFLSQYGEYEPVVQKFEMMKKQLQVLGYNLEK